MNFKDYSLNDHIEHTLNAFAYRKDNIRVDITEDCNIHRTGSVVVQTYKGKICTDVRTTKNHLSIEYDGAYKYSKSYSEEKFIGVNVEYAKDLLRKRVSRKSNDFYTLYYSKDDVSAYKNTKDGKYVFEMNGTHKMYKINTARTNYTEKYTIVSNKLVESCLANNKISVTLSKTLSGKVGNCRIKRFKDAKVINFELEGEPCILRLMNNTVIFNALMNSELGTYIEEIREMIVDAFQNLKKVPVNSTSFDSILEFYTKNAD